MGSLSFQLRGVIDALREEGLSIGGVGIRLYRPFPDEVIAEVLSNARGVIIFEKAISYGYLGPLASDIRSALYGNTGRKEKMPFVHNYVLGLGGRKISNRDLAEALRNSCKEEQFTDMSDTLKWAGLNI